MQCQFSRARGNSLQYLDFMRTFDTCFCSDDTEVDTDSEDDLLLDVGLSDLEDCLEDSDLEDSDLEDCLEEDDW